MRDTIPLPAQMKIALIAHDARKDDKLEWVNFNRGTLSKQFLFATGTAGSIIANELIYPSIVIKADLLTTTSRLEPESQKRRSTS